MNNPIAVCVDRNPFATLEELVALAAEVGFDRIEWFEVKEPDPWTAPGVAGHIRTLMKRYGLGTQYHAPYEETFDLARDGDAPRAPADIAATLIKCLDRAERIEARLVTAHLGTCPAGMERSDMFRRLLDGIQRTIPELERRGIRLALENHTSAILKGAIGDQAHDFERLMSNVQSEWVGRTFDVGHAYIDGVLENFLALPFDRVFNVHMHDNRGAQDEHLPLGDGTAPWDMIMSRFAEACCAGVLTFEFFAASEIYSRCIKMVRSA